MSYVAYAAGIESDPDLSQLVKLGEPRVVPSLIDADVHHDRPGARTLGSLRRGHRVAHVEEVDADAGAEVPAAIDRVLDGEPGYERRDRHATCAHVGRSIDEAGCGRLDHQVELEVDAREALADRSCALQAQELDERLADLELVSSRLQGRGREGRRRLDLSDVQRYLDPRR